MGLKAYNKGIKSKKEYFMKKAFKLEVYKWCAKTKTYVLEETTPSVVVGMLKAKRLALKGLEVSA